MELMQADGRRGRVLLVEDDVDHAAVLARWLGAVGLDVVVETDGIEGAMAAARQPFDAVVSDVALPSVSGMLVAHQSKAHHPQRPVVVMTGEGSETVAIEALREGADDYFVKPLVRENFVARVYQLVVGARVRARVRTRTVLAIGAHPDDVEIGCGGTLLRHREQGDRVIVLTLSSGEAGGRSDTRLSEARSAADRLGAELVMADLPDTRIDEGGTTIEAIASAIRRYAPDVVYTHTAADNHQDHRAVARATLVAARNVPSLLCYQSPSTNLEFRPGRYVDVEKQMAGKLELLATYASQAERRPYLADDVVQSTARYWGRFAGFRLVEPLEVVRVVD